MFNIPVKEIIVNDDSQVVLLEDDGTAYADNDVTGSAGGFKLQGFLEEVVWVTSAVASANAPAGIGNSLKLLSSATRMIRDAASAGAFEVKSYAVQSTSSPADAEFRVTADGMESGSVEFQQSIPKEKRYQISAAQASAAAIAAKIAAVINNDTKAAVTATATNKYVTITSKVRGLKINLYGVDFLTYNQTPAATPATGTRSTTTLTVTFANHGLTTGDSINVISTPDATMLTLGAKTVTVSDANTFTITVLNAGVSSASFLYTVGTNTVGTFPVNTYDYLKQINWAKNFHIDRNINWMPLPGVSYNSYYFVVSAPDPVTGSIETPSQVQGNVETGYRLYVKSGTTLDTALNFLTGDVNV